MNNSKEYIEYNRINMFEYIKQHSPNVRFALCTRVYECAEGLMIRSLINDKVHLTDDDKITQDDLNNILEELNGFYPIDPEEVMEEDDEIVYLSYSDLLKYGHFDDCTANGVCNYPFGYVIVDFSK